MSKQKKTNYQLAAEELRKAHEELKKSMTLFGPEEDVFKVFGNSMQAGIYVIQDLKTIFTNSYISSYSGYSPKELMNLSLFQDTVHPEDQAHVRECGIKMLKGEDLAPYEYRIICKDGSIKWLMEKVTSIKYRGQRAILGNTMDVTDKKRTEDELRNIKAKLEIRIQERTAALSAANEALKKSEEMLRLITDNMSDMISVADLQGVNLYVSPSHLKGLGWKPEEQIGKAVFDRVHPDDVERVINLFSAGFINGQKPVKAEYRVKHAEGHYLWLETIGDLLRDNQGEATAVIMNSRDISERKAAGEKLNKSERKYHELADFLPQIVFELDEKGDLTFINRNALLMTGHTQADIEKNWAVLQTFIPEDRDRARSNIQRALLEGTSKGNEYTFLRKDGSTFPAAIRTNTIMCDNQAVGLRGVAVDISNLRKAEEALKESENRYKAIFENTGTATVILEEDTTVSLVNSKFEMLTGYTREEIEGRKSWTEFVAKEDLERMLAQHHRRRVNEDDAQKSYEFRLVDRNGQIKDIYLKIDMIPGTRKSVASLLDITDRKRAEGALNESRRLMHDIIQGSPIPAFVIDKNHTIIYWNRALEELSGLRAEDMVGTSQQWQAFYREKRPCMADVLADADITAMNLLYPGKYVKSTLLDEAYEGTDFFPEIGGGSGRWIRFTAAVIKNSQGDTIGVIETIEDITERREAEVALISEHERLASILDGIPIPTFVIDRNHRVVLWNRHNEIYTGVAKKEVIGKPLNLSFLFPQKASPALAELILEMSDEELVAKFDRRGLSKSEIQPHAFESTGLIWLNGEERTLSIQAARIFDFKGALVGAIQTGQDVTEHMQLESQLRQAQKIQAIGTLAGGIAHDFNNILSAIMGYTDMALKDHKIDDRLRRYLEQVFKAGERARDLVKQILVFSRQSDEKPRPMRVSPIIREVLKLLKASLPSTIEIRQEIQSAPDTIIIDPTHIHQILMNLCTNAAHAMRNKKGVLKVTLFPVEIAPDDALIIHYGLNPGMYLKLTVSDTGHGIDPIIIDRIFDPFFTTKKPGEGTGMGLSVVFGTVKGYDGAVTVKSKVGEGTEVHVYLPLLMETGGVREAKEETPITGGKEKVLFVDDEEAIVKLGKDTLTSIGYDVVGKTSSLDALELFRSCASRFDIVITDMTMPDMTGVELAQEIMRVRPDIPVILCTGFSETITPETAKVLGIKEFLMKPIVMYQMAAAIRRVLDQKESLRMRL